MDKTATGPFIAVVSGALLVAVGAGSGEVSGTGVFRSFLAWRQAEQGGCFLHRGGRAVQGPYTSLDPRQSAESAVDEVLRLHHGWPAGRRRVRVAELMDLVGLDSRQSRALPRSLSGGQRQRAAIARALAAQPSVLILDESVAALDVSIQAQVLNLLADIRDETGVSYLLISHDLAVVRQLTDDTLVLRRGTVVERGPTGRVLDNPEQPYTQQLRASVPRPGWKPERLGFPPNRGMKLTPPRGGLMPAASEAYEPGGEIRGNPAQVGDLRRRVRRGWVRARPRPDIGSGC